MSTLIFGHKNPDTDSVVSAISLSYLKTQLGYETMPCILDPINKETAFVLDYFQLEIPQQIDNVKVQVKDLDFHITEGIKESTSILSAYNLMDKEKIATLAIVNQLGELLGIVSIKDIAVSLITGDFRKLETSMDNLISDLDGNLLSKGLWYFRGNVSVIDDYHKTIRGLLGPEDIIIVGDRYDIIEYAIESNVQLIVVTGNREIPEKFLIRAQEQNIAMISVPYDSLYTTRVIDQCNYISKIMRSTNITRFSNRDYLDDVKETMSQSHYRNYPVVNQDKKFLGFVGRKHILNPKRKKAILVDHNEYAQSAEGLEESEILEIIDHHKLGDISTAMPISFRNNPVGSTATIVYSMFRENQVKIPVSISGILLSGILSDTLSFRSPTTTPADQAAVKSLNEILNYDLENYAMKMFKAGTSLEGQSIDEIFYKDYKEFNLNFYKAGISQVFTLDIEEVFRQKEEFLAFINQTHKKENHDITLLLITDILKEGSYILYASKKTNIISTAFNIPKKQGGFIPGVVSRKKQVLPRLINAIELME
ncbi:putative manganese-dependent inorganic diphosphatase [Isachenkonia alkalipeptolytica]|uniref:inorganic diphosphatase n=1 Tax=Isachenkonia alkalipeptolytica TaxID=2565777 RepID=A0AA43XM67_9CLOT|nr:putative manganese-dependent inorganic diphosphatase [Isachenkonia alkalipeptolytica]NBG88505.1 putative manganese-dependent inorganic diphosphatase [Isachenkonia alkalipeptolytica]